jgi:hypothetical protein
MSIDTTSPDRSLVYAYAHIPYVDITPEEASMGDGKLVHLPFEFWAHLDKGFTRANLHYERSRPLFYCEVFDRSDGPDEPQFDPVREMFEEAVHSLYRAVLLALATRLPPPALSVAYYYDRTTGQHISTLGPFEREALLYRPGERLRLDERLEHIRTNLRFLVDHPRVLELPELVATFGALERTSLPEFSALTSFVHEVIALESLLIPDVRSQLTANFARRAAIFLADDPTEIQKLHEEARGWYRARSEALHGGDYHALVNRVSGGDEDAFFWRVRTALVTTLARTLTFVAAHNAEPASLIELRHQLDAAWADEDEFWRLRSAFPS